MTEKCYKLYGTKILNLRTQEIGLLICIWKNKFADGDIDFATCVDKQGKYNLIPCFGDTEICEITYEMIVDFMRKMKEKYKPKTASNAVTLLGSILKYAFEQGYIKHNPYYGIKNSKCR